MDRVLRPERLGREFFARASPVVAKALIGMLLVHRAEDGRAGGIIVETEAYREDDPASHSFRGKTARNAPMFGPPGHAYVYFTYGMHWCFNVVSGEEGTGEGILIRAIEPTSGLSHMKRRRGTDVVRDLARGPGRLAQALAIGPKNFGQDLVRGTIGIYRMPERIRRPYRRIEATSRIGISKGVEKAWRFSTMDCPFVSGR